jgi:hypothetical protein
MERRKEDALDYLSTGAAALLGAVIATWLLRPEAFWPAFWADVPFCFWLIHTITVARRFFTTRGL